MRCNVKIVVIDGQGGNLGSRIIKGLLSRNCQEEIIAIGTNSTAAGAMLHAGAHRSATGENPVVVMSKKADLIVGPMGIIIADAMMGEITSKMAEAVARSEAEKILIPMDRCGVFVAGVERKSMNEYIGDTIQLVMERIEKDKKTAESNDNI